MLADLEARGYLWPWGYVAEDVRHGLVTWRVVLRAGLPVPRARDLLSASTPYLPKGAICSAGVPEARLHPNTVLSITAFLLARLPPADAGWPPTSFRAPCLVSWGSLLPLPLRR